MKKKVAITTIVGLLLLIGGLVFLCFTGDIITITVGGVKGPLYLSSQIFTNLGALLAAEFTNPQLMMYINVGVCGVLLLLYIAHIIYYACKKHAASLFVTIAGLIAIAAIFGLLTVFFTPGLTEPLIGGIFGAADGASFGLLVLINSALSNQAWIALVFYVGPLLALIGFILVFVGLCCDFKLLSDLEAPKEKAATDDEIVVVHDEDLESELAAEEAEAALKEGGYNERHNVSAPLPQAPVAAGIQGPLLIQYINTYAPAPEAARPAEPAPAPERKPNAVPVSEIQGAITGEKPLNADDIRKIIQEELGENKDQPVIVNVPAQPRDEAPKGLSAEDVRAIFSEELGRYLTSDVAEDEQTEDEILVEEDAAPALSAEDIRAIIAAELAKSAAPAKEEEKPVDVRDVVREELAAHAAKLEEAAKAKEAEELAAKARAEELEKARKEAAEEAKKEAEKQLTAEDIRAIIAAELSKKEPEPEPKKDEFTIDTLRDIIREELREVAPVKEEKVPPVTVVVKESDIVRPEPKPEEPKEEQLLPTVNIIVKSVEPKVEEVVVAPAPAPEPEPEPEPEPAPAPAPEVIRVVGAVNPELPPHDKIIRIPFQTRMRTAEKELRDNYNELKSEILSYGVKSRVSNSGDTFRLHKVTFVKITIAGKGLKLYYALDPKDYENSTLPVLDAGHKGVYRDIPLVFKVKSDLSLRRAKQLIADVMEKNGLEQGKIEPHDWASELHEDENDSDED